MVEWVTSQTTSQKTKGHLLECGLFIFCSSLICQYPARQQDTPNEDGGYELDKSNDSCTEQQLPATTAVLKALPKKDKIGRQNFQVMLEVREAREFREINARL